MLASQALHLLPDRSIVLGRPARTSSIAQTIQSVGGEGPAPLPDGYFGQVELDRDLQVESPAAARSTIWLRTASDWDVEGACTKLSNVD